MASKESPAGQASLHAPTSEQAPKSSAAAAAIESARPALWLTLGQHRQFGDLRADEEMG